MQKIMLTEACPAETIKNYLREIIKVQKLFLKNNIPIPNDTKLPGEIYITTDALKNLINSPFIDFQGIGNNELEMCFFCKENEEFPSLEIRVLKLEDGRNVISYIREDAREHDIGLLWIRNSSNASIVLFKRTDDLEEILSLKR